MNDMQVIEHNNQRVLLTKRLAEQYETTERRISENFNRNKERFIEGKHYYHLENVDLKSFKRKYANCVVAENLNKLYLWTEKGALLHAKSLNTDKAWEMYDYLVDSYFQYNDTVTHVEVKTELKSDKLKELEIKEMNARVRLANQYIKMSKLDVYSHEAKVTLISKATEVLAGTKIVYPGYLDKPAKGSFNLLSYMLDELSKSN